MLVCALLSSSSAHFSTLQTVIPRCLGTMDRWVPVLRYSSECGYNMVHFTPVTQIGESRSAYSLSDQLVVDNELLPPGVDVARGFEALDKTLAEVSVFY